MIIIDEPKIEYSDEISFTGIKKEIYHKEIAKLDSKIRRDMKKNEISEMKSNEFADKFVTTVNTPT